MEWQRRTSTKIRPPGFVEPAVAVLTQRAPSGRRWLHEIKHDGYRLIARIGDGVRAWSRHRTNFTGVFPRIDEALRRLPTASAVLDGEAIIELPSGHHDFNGLCTEKGKRRAILLVFDVMEHEGIDVCDKPLIERRAMFAELLADAPPALRFQEHLEGDGEEIVRHVCSLGLEGIVSKLKTSPYVGGRTRTWQKRKCADYARRSAGG